MKKDQKEREKVATTAHLIADSEGRPQLHTLRSTPSKAWKALWDRTLTTKEREQLKRQGFRVEYVFVRSYWQ